MTKPVPAITIKGRSVSSDASLPRAIADICASWTDKDRRAGQRLLAKEGDVVAQDKTAYAALLALSLAMLHQGKTVKAKIIKGFDRETAQ